MAEILTNNAMFSSFMIVLFALGDIVGKITKGKLSGMMVVMLLFLVGFLTKLIPADIIDQGGLTALSKLAIAMILFNMGTTLNVKQLIEEWRTVLMAALCMLASCLVMLLVSPIIGFDTKASLALKQFPWEGNLHQLQRIIYELMLITSTPYISYENTMRLLHQETALWVAPEQSGYQFDLNQTLDDITYDVVRMVLKEENNNQSRTAQRLGIGRSTLWRILKSHAEPNLHE